jgi:ribosomal protein S18 acetylase RimI-like enzyme
MDKKMTVDISFRNAEEKDRAFLLELRNMTMNEHIVKAGLAIDQGIHIERINYHFNAAKIIESSNRPIGLLKVVKEIPIWDLVQIQLISEYQGLGIGRHVISDVVSEAKKMQTPVKLSVFKTNPAFRLYVSLGFRVYDETEKTYEMLVDFN